MPPDPSQPLAEPPLMAPFGCESCRVQHLKCDRALPACGRCVSTSKACTRGYKFRVKSVPYPRGQQWAKIPKRLDFVADGVTGDAEFYSDDDDEPEPPAPASSPPRPAPLPSRPSQATPPAAPHTQNHSPPNGSYSPASSEDVSSHSATARPIATSAVQRVPLTEGRRRSTRLTQQNQAKHAQTQQLSPTSTYGNGNGNGSGNAIGDLASGSDDSPRSPTDRFIVQDEYLPPLHAHGPPVLPPMHPPMLPLVRSPLILSAETQPAHPNIYTHRSVYPLNEEREAMLLRHYIQNLAIWLDLCEPSHQFGAIVPQRAATCTVLLNAILALSSKHLAHHGNFDRYASDHYHQECLNVLIPMLNHADTAADENLFAATIILRVWEEMEFKHSGFDSQGYLLGIHAFVHGHGHKIVPNTLSAAAFWVGLRQEIYTATINQQPVKAPLALSLADKARELGPAEDHDWANRAVIHCVDVLNFCFGDNNTISSPRFSWEELNRWNEEWFARLPDSYRAILYKERGPGEAFPTIWHLSSWHVTGIQHHILAQLFLVSFDPKIPRMGGQRVEAAKAVNNRVCDLVRQICGIGLGNQWTPPAMFTACMAITAFGDRFQDLQDQEALLKMLRRTEKDHARPTEAVQKQLMRSWGRDLGQVAQTTTVDTSTAINNSPHH